MENKRDTSAENIEKIAALYEQIIPLLGENPKREGLLKTPERFAKALQFLTKGYDENPEDILKSALFHEDYSEMVIVKDIEVYSQCATNEIGFSGLPGGGRYLDGSYSTIGSYGFFWSSTEYIPTHFWMRLLSFDSGDMPRANLSKGAGICVRCIKD